MYGQCLPCRAGGRPSEWPGSGPAPCRWRGRDPPGGGMVRARPPSSRPATPGPAVSPRPSGTCDLNHLQLVIDGFPSNLSAGQFSAARQLVCDYADIFSASDFDLGHCDALPHHIDTGEARPFKEQLRRHPIAHLGFIDDQVDRML